MAKYSKDLWPNMATIVRVDPKYLSSSHRYLDAAWAQYLWRRGNVDSYAREMVSEAQRKGVQLIVGLNILKGGAPNGSPMTRERGRGFRLRPAGQHVSLRLHQLEVHLQLHEQQQHQERHEQPSPQGREPRLQELPQLSHRRSLESSNRRSLNAASGLVFRLCE